MSEFTRLTVLLLLSAGVSSQSDQTCSVDVVSILTITVFYGIKEPTSLSVPVDVSPDCIPGTTVTIKRSHANIERLRFVKPISPTIRGVNISRNHLRTIPDPPVPSYFRELILSRNHISRIERLSAYTEIEKVDLSYNAIAKINRLVLQKLTHLDLTGNRISTIDTESFYLVYNLKHLNLSSNRLIHIAMCRFNNWIYINVTGNPELARERILCKQCWCHWPLLSYRCNPSANVCSDDVEDFKFVEERGAVVTATISPRSYEEDSNYMTYFIVGLSAALLVFFVGLVAIGCCIYRRKCRGTPVPIVQVVYTSSEVTNKGADHTPASNIYERSFYSAPYDHFPYYPKS